MDRTPNIRPLLGSHPLSCFLSVIFLLTLIPFVPFGIAYIISWVTFVLISIALVAWRMPWATRPSSIVTLLTLLTSGLLYLLWGDYLIWSLFRQGIVVLCFLPTLFLVNKFLLSEVREVNSLKSFNQRTLHNQIVITEYTRVSRFLKLISLLFLILGLVIYFNKHHSGVFGLSLITGYVFLVIIWGEYIVETINLVLIRKKLKTEQWIPILDSCGNVVGRVFRSQEALHVGILPVVRVIVVSKGMIYLVNRCEDDLIEDDCYDTPFVSWVTGNNSASCIALDMVKKFIPDFKSDDLRPIVKYRHTTSNGAAVAVQLFYFNLSDPSLLSNADCEPLEAKWWPVDQIMRQLDGTLFSSYLRSEMPYLKQTVLLAEKLRFKRKIKNSQNSE